jgi:ribosomal protein S18 acetylase RimI-like enzyme
MSESVEYCFNKASESKIAEHLERCDADFMPPLSSRVEIKDYAQKIAKKAIRLEAWSDGTLVGLVAAYYNDLENRVVYISNVSVLREWSKKGIATRLLKKCIKYARAMEMQQVCLEVSTDNKPAVKLYEKSGFIADKPDAPFVSMNLHLESGKT